MDVIHICAASHCIETFQNKTLAAYQPGCTFKIYQNCIWGFLYDLKNLFPDYQSYNLPSISLFLRLQDFKPFKAAGLRRWVPALVDEICPVLGRVERIHQKDYIWSFVAQLSIAGSSYFAPQITQLSNGYVLSPVVSCQPPTVTPLFSSGGLASSTMA